MASIVLGTIASSALGASFGILGQASGYFLGSYLGNSVDSKIFGTRSIPKTQGFRLQDLLIQSSAYGSPIPQVYGNIRIAGNIIWALPIHESIEHHTQSARVGKGGGKKISQTYSEYKYYATIAISICKGPIDNVTKIWADTKLLNLQNLAYRFYKGDNSQLPDSLIESIEGKGKTPSYRGLSYIVIENFPLTDFGNRIPNFTFEVAYKPKIDVPNFEEVENLIDGMVIMPASGEFVYETEKVTKSFGEYRNNKWIQKGKRNTINVNNNEFKPDAVIALNQLQETCPNLKWTSLTCSWFTNSLDIHTAKILPGVEYKDAENFPYPWEVANFTRKKAYQINFDKDNLIRFGGTPSDRSILNHITELKARNLKVLFYPLIMVDIEGKPWRGRITGKNEDIVKFFNDKNGYNEFILHYANLVKGKIDAFAIGSELIGITKIKDKNNNFLAVKELIKLAKQVKEILGKDVLVTYAADWSEYHHTDGGFYNLDELWASEHIDMVGIDAYFPLTEGPQKDYDIDSIIQSFTSGECYDYYYDHNIKKKLDSKYAIKNIKYWWENYHYNPKGDRTKWQPKMKKFWFTEFGFPSVDSCTNQPNVFYDPKSVDGGLPKYSKGNIDFIAQRTAILASLKFIKSQEYIEQSFLWCFDARPFPYWPDLKQLWSDGDLWATGHWVNGKLGKTSLAQVVADLCVKSGIDINHIDVTRLNQTIEGFVLPEQMTARNAIETLASAFFFDVIESEGIIKFIPRTNKIPIEINNEELIFTDANTPNITATRKQEIDLPYKVDVIYLSKELDYQQSIKSASRDIKNTQNKENINLPIVLSDLQAKRVAEITLFTSWLEQNSFNFKLPIKYIFLEPGDIVSVKFANRDFLLRIIKVSIGANFEIEITASQDEPSLYDAQKLSKKNHSINLLSNNEDVIFHLFEIPNLNENNNDKIKINLSACSLGSSWNGIQIYEADNLEYITSIPIEGTIGHIISDLKKSSAFVINTHEKIEVVLINGEIEEIENEFQFAVIGNEVIGFQKCELINDNHYILSNIIRGFNSEISSVQSHEIGTRFILLNKAVVTLNLPTEKIRANVKYKIAISGDDLQSLPTHEYCIKALNLKPLSPILHNIEYNNDKTKITWLRRSRIPITLKDNISVPLGETREEYLIEFYNNDTLIFSVNTHNNFLEFNKSQFPQIPTKLTIYQISESFGKGENLTINL
ncbi:MAG: glycoside hydrolase TIM-barrel-like domain-containing protein [Sphingobacteriia bacterium]|nr:glycoside hydrolase TIM-barrel-like domain-containing protein [Sphingobacteriia bacterium]